MQNEPHDCSKDEKVTEVFKYKRVLVICLLKFEFLQLIAESERLQQEVREVRNVMNHLVWQLLQALGRKKLDIELPDSSNPTKVEIPTSIDGVSVLDFE